jgi:hypothetical protein
LHPASIAVPMLRVASDMLALGLWAARGHRRRRWEGPLLPARPRPSAPMLAAVRS